MPEHIKDWHQFIFGTKNEDRDFELFTQLKFPQNKIDVVLDTDAYNEIDDQFAIAYMLKSQEKLNTKAIYAAPFYNDRSTSPEDGMVKSYREIIKLLELMNREDVTPNVFKGSKEYLADEKTPVISDVAKDLAKRAMGYSKENPLYVVAIGAITNIASAILIEPKIIENIVVVWLGGHAYHWPHNREFNSYQDVAADRVVFNSTVPLVQLPCMGVVSSFTVSKPELTEYLKGGNKLCQYLYKHTVEVAEQESSIDTWSRIIWDVTAVAWLISEDFMESRIERCPIPQYDNNYSFSGNRHFCRYVYHINRDTLISDLFKKLKA